MEKQTAYTYACTMNFLLDLSEEIKPEESGRRKCEFRLVKLIFSLQPAFVLFDTETIQTSRL